MATVAMDAVACTACRTRGDKPTAVTILFGQTEAVGDRGRLAAAGHASLARMRQTWTPAVPSAMYSSRPICRLVRPRARGHSAAAQILRLRCRMDTARTVM